MRQDVKVLCVKELGIARGWAGTLASNRRPIEFKGLDPRAYIGVSRTTFSTPASSTVVLDKCSSAFTWATVI